MARPIPRPLPVMTATLSLSMCENTCLRYPPDNFLRGDRHFIDFDAEGLERVFDGAGHCWRRHHAPTFAAAFDAVGGEGRWRFVVVDVDIGYLGGGWQQIVVQGGGQVLALGAIAHLFVERDTDALCNATANLPFQRAWVHHRANVMYCHKLEECDFACFYVNFHNGDMDGVAHNRLEGAQVFAVL